VHLRNIVDKIIANLDEVQITAAAPGRRLTVFPSKPGGRIARGLGYGCNIAIKRTVFSFI
jgi:hypothetical protein